MNKDLYYLNIAETVAQRSKCVSLQVGCVIVKNDKIISTGINGTPRGYTNCCDKFKERCDEHHTWSLKYETHAEIAALIQAETSIEGSKVYCTHSPCFNCLKYLIRAGVDAIYYREQYFRDTEEVIQENIDFCKEMGVGLVHCSNGFKFLSLNKTLVNELFEYKGFGLYWRHRPDEHFSCTRSAKSWNRKNAGNRYGADHSNHKTTYRRGTISDKPYLEHSLVWLYHKGFYPTHTVDHINGIGYDNRIENLREASYTDQSRNHPIREDNTTGYPGIRKLSSGSYAVSISSEHQGTCKTYEEALDFRKSLEVDYGYNENHGRI